MARFKNALDGPNQVYLKGEPLYQLAAGEEKEASSKAEEKALRETPGVVRVKEPSKK